MKNTILKNHNRIKVSIEVVLGQEGEYTVAYCPALDFSSYGKNEVDAKKAFNEALEIFFEETNANGTLEKFLLKQGWQLQQIPEPKYIPPKNNQNYFGGTVRKYNEPVSIPA